MWSKFDEMKMLMCTIVIYSFLTRNNTEEYRYEMDQRYNAGVPKASEIKLNKPIPVPVSGPQHLGEERQPLLLKDNEVRE